MRSDDHPARRTPCASQSCTTAPEIEHEPDARLEDIEWADGIAFGTPTRFGNVATAFTSSQTEHGGQESTTLALNNTLCHRGAIIVPLGYTVHEVFNGGENPYGVSFTESYTRTSVVRGIFRKKAEARAEALELLRAA